MPNDDVTRPRDGGSAAPSADAPPPPSHDATAGAERESSAVRSASRATDGAATEEPRVSHEHAPSAAELSDGLGADGVDWPTVARHVLTSREMDRVEETELVPEGLITYQFSAKGHELSQVLLGMALTHPHDGAGVYYRSRPLMLTAGLTVEEAFAASMGRRHSPSAGRDVGVVFSLPPRSGPVILPSAGGVGTQYTTSVGWASGIRARIEVLGHRDWSRAMAVAHGGDGSTSTPGFWAALNIATANDLPFLLFIEDNGFAISVPSHVQWPGRSIADNLASYGNLRIVDGEGTEPAEAADLVANAVTHIREGRGPVLLRLRVPRLTGHSFADTQAYKSNETRADEAIRDPIPRLKDYLVPRRMSAAAWDALVESVRTDVADARDRAKAQDVDALDRTTRFVFHEPDRSPVIGGTRPEGAGVPVGETTEPRPPEPVRMNMVDAIRQTIEHEMTLTKRVLVFGEDVGVKGGVHGVTRDLQRQFGEARVFDTSLNEEGIIGRATGLAVAGLVPVPEIQFRKYADPATEQLNDAGTVRWRTAGAFAAPMVVRIPIGVSRVTGDPWHSVSAESVYAHSPGWRIAIPSNAEDAVGLLRAALRGDDPTFFLEHRSLYDGAVARRPYPGDDYVLPFGRGVVARSGTDVTVVAWGEMVHRCLDASESMRDRVEVIDLRTIVPWDREIVLESVRRTGRCVVAHEDTRTTGFGAEVAAFVADEAFPWLDAPVRRIASEDCPVPYAREIMAAVVPDVEAIREALEDTLAF